MPVNAVGWSTWRLCPACWRLCSVDDGAEKKIKIINLYRGITISERI